MFFFFFFKNENKGTTPTKIHKTASNAKVRNSQQQTKKKCKIKCAQNILNAKIRKKKKYTQYCFICKKSPDINNWIALPNILPCEIFD